ncbi:MAG TPA: endonuclease domain-containing protein, partial [Coleofasciculaceae cyanobacterium]
TPMTKLFNKTSEKLKRRELRTNMTKAEAIVWQKLRCKQLENCKFRNQYSVDRFVLDFYSPELKLAIEIDGESHFQEGVAQYDKERQIFIESAGIQFLRFTNQDVYENLNGVLETIASKIRELRNGLLLTGVNPPNPP